MCPDKVVATDVVVQVDSTAEGEAQRYFDHALTLRDTILFLRHNRELSLDAVDQNGGSGSGGPGLGVDLLRCESLLGLDPATCARVLNKNYAYVSFRNACVTQLAGRYTDNPVCGGLLFFCGISGNLEMSGKLAKVGEKSGKGPKSG